MVFFTIRLRQFCAAMLAVMLLGALSPAISRTLHGVQKASPAWFEVCTQEGVTQPSPESDGNPSPPSRHLFSGLDHCPLCVLASDRLALATPDFVWTGSPQASPPVFFTPPPPHPSFFFWAARSRAPPSFS